MEEPLQHYHWPIIYVRGYAMTQKEIDETAADPFCGFNLGSTQYRARPDKKLPPQNFIFESPLVRLQSDYGYHDVYENGLDIMEDHWVGQEKFNGGIERRSVIVYRYYDEVSSQFGGPNRPKPDVVRFARGLNDLIREVRKLVIRCESNESTAENFRCYLVAHSMGGLVCRAFLQNPEVGDRELVGRVAKFFTYATPHNGIDVAGVNIPDWLKLFDVDTFSRKNMAKYLAIPKNARDQFPDRVDLIPEDRFPSRNIFCMIGTNRGDYEAAFGASRTFVGHGSDGLVRIDNASVWGVDKTGKMSAPTATAYAYRAHSGRYGIVNGEESYQNLARFLFGDLRVDMWADITEVRVPQELQKDDAKGKVDALYLFEVFAAPRGKRWHLTRRTAEEDSVAVRRHRDVRGVSESKPARIHLSTVFLANRYKVDQAGDTLAYVLTFGVKIPEYEVDKKFWPNRHFEGSDLFRDSLVVELRMPTEEDGDWTVTHDWQSDDAAQSSRPVERQRFLKDGSVELLFEFKSGDKKDPKGPGIRGNLRFVVSQWNVTGDNSR
jgi:hypothetical protein